MVPGDSKPKPTPRKKRKNDATFVRMRCPNCELAVQGAPERFQDTLKCPNCEQEGIFLRITEMHGVNTTGNVFKHIADILPRDKSRHKASEKHDTIGSMLAQKDKSLLIRMKCSKCGAIVRSTPGKVNSTVRCPNCNHNSVFHRAPENEENILPFAAGVGGLHNAAAYSIPWNYVAASFFVGILLASILFYFNPIGTVTLKNSHPQVIKLAQILKVITPEKRRIHLDNYLKELPNLKEMSPLRIEAMAALNEINEGLLAESTDRQKEALERYSLLQTETAALKASLRGDEKESWLLKEENNKLEATGKSLAEELATEQKNTAVLSAKLASLTNTASADNAELLALKKQFRNFRNAKENSNPIDVKILQEISTKTSPAIIALRVKNLDGEIHRGFGCIVVVQERELILTGANLIRYATEIVATDVNDKEHFIDGAYMIDETKGVTLLSLPESAGAGRGLQLSKSPPSLGDTVITPGALEGKAYLPMRGFVSQLRRLQSEWIHNSLAVQTDLALSPDSEGSPLLNIAGEIIGINIMLNGREQAQNFIVDLAGIKDSKLFKDPILLTEIEATKNEAARRDRLKAEKRRRSENIQMYYKKGYKMSDVGLMLQVLEIQKGEGDAVFNIDLQIVNPRLSPLAGEELYLVGFDAYTRGKAWSKLITPVFEGEGWGKEDILLEGFKIEEEALKRMSWNIIRGMNKLELFIGME